MFEFDISDNQGLFCPLPTCCANNTRCLDTPLVGEKCCILNNCTTYTPSYTYPPVYYVPTPGTLSPTYPSPLPPPSPSPTPDGHSRVAEKNLSLPVLGIIVIITMVLIVVLVTYRSRKSDGDRGGEESRHLLEVSREGEVRCKNNRVCLVNSSSLSVFLKRTFIS